MTTEVDAPSHLLGDVHVVAQGAICHRRVRFHEGRPLGFARLLSADERAENPPYRGSLLPGYLRAAGAIQLSHRHPVAVPSALLPAVKTALLEHVMRSRQSDPAWIEIGHCRADIDGTDHRLTCLLLTKRQRYWLNQGGAIAKVTVPTGQILEAALLGAGEATDNVPSEYREQLLDIPGVTLAPPLFQLGSGYQRHAKHDNPYLCVLHPVHHTWLGNGYCMIRNHYLEEAYPGLMAAITALPEYDSAVPEQRVSLDATLSLSIGVRFGEVCTIERLMTNPSRASRRVFRYRHSICRVGRTGPADMEKPLARLPEEVLDGIGIEGGAQVVIEGVTKLTTGSVPEISRIKLRGLPIRGPLLPFTPDTPDYLTKLAA